MASKSNGVAMLVSGGICLVLGMLLTWTVFGGCIGIPMMILGLILMPIGGFQYRRAALEDLRGSIHDGIVEGMRQPSAQQKTCSHCGASVTVNAKFCPECGKSTSPDQREGDEEESRQ